MISVVEEPTNVPGPGGQMMKVLPGDVWPLPYRGSKYTVRKFDGKLQMCWTRLDATHLSLDLPDGLIRVLHKHKFDTRGSFLTTPHREMITKRELSDGGCRPTYVGRVEGVYSFPGFDLDPSDLQTGSLWPGLHFKHGEVFAVWLREGNEHHLYWTTRGLYFRSIDKYPELCSLVREIRPRCGRIYMTEFGHVWMNLPRSEVSDKWAPKFATVMNDARELLSNGENDILLTSIFERVKATGCYPIYLGRMDDFDSGVAPRTHFRAGAGFGRGGEDVDDDDQFAAKSWKKMMRDY